MYVLINAEFLKYHSYNVYKSHLNIMVFKEPSVAFDVFYLWITVLFLQGILY